MSLNGKHLIGMTRHEDIVEQPQPSRRGDVAIGCLLLAVVVLIVGVVIVEFSYVVPTLKIVSTQLTEMRDWQQRQRDAEQKKAESERESAKSGDLARQRYIDQQSQLITQQKQVKELMDANARLAEELNRKLRSTP